MGARIRAARTAKRWTQRALAEQMTISRQAVAQWETGRHWPSALQIEALRRLLNVELPLEPDPLPPPVPAALSAEAARGMRYAALAMSEVVTRLLREALAAEDAAAEAAERRRRRGA